MTTNTLTDCKRTEPRVVSESQRLTAPCASQSTLANDMFKQPAELMGEHDTQPPSLMSLFGRVTLPPTPTDIPTNHLLVTHYFRVPAGVEEGVRGGAEAVIKYAFANHVNMSACQHLDGKKIKKCI